MSKAKTKKMPIWLDVTLRVIEWTLIIFIVVCMLVLLSQKLTGNTPELFGYSTYTVVTDSMAGTYDVGDVVLCKRTKDPLEYNNTIGFKEGDVIAFIAPVGFDERGLLQGQTITHRIVTAPYYNEENDTWYVETKGDAAYTQDKVPIPVENILGTIIGASKGISTLVRFITKWYGFAIVVVIPLLAILIWQIYVLIREKERAELLKIEKSKEEFKQKRIEKLKEEAIREYQQANASKNVEE